jgi:hypothetical protein
MKHGKASGIITVLEATYINTADEKPPEFIGLWFWDENVPHDESKARLQLFALDRADILCLENGDKGTLTRTGERWDFTPQSN